jgi:hypothetical protein
MVGSVERGLAIGRRGRGTLRTDEAHARRRDDCENQVTHVNSSFFGGGIAAIQRIFTLSDSARPGLGARSSWVHLDHD